MSPSVSAMGAVSMIQRCPPTHGRFQDLSNCKGMFQRRGLELQSFCRHESRFPKHTRSYVSTANGFVRVPPDEPSFSENLQRRFRIYNMNFSRTSARACELISIAKNPAKGNDDAKLTNVVFATFFCSRQDCNRSD